MKLVTFSAVLHDGAVHAKAILVSAALCQTSFPEKRGVTSHVGRAYFFRSLQRGSSSAPRKQCRPARHGLSATAQGQHKDCMRKGDVGP